MHAKYFDIKREISLIKLFFFSFVSWYTLSTLYYYTLKINRFQYNLFNFWFRERVVE